MWLALWVLLVLRQGFGNISDIFETTNDWGDSKNSPTLEGLVYLGDRFIIVFPQRA